MLWACLSPGWAWLPHSCPSWPCLFAPSTSAPFGSRSPCWSHGERWQDCRQEVIFSFSCCQPHQPWLLPFLSDSSAKARWKSLGWPYLLPLKSSPKGFLCTQVPSAPHSSPCHVTIIPNHVSFGQAVHTWLGKGPPVRVKVCAAVQGCGGGALGLSDRLNHAMWHFPRRQHSSRKQKVRLTQLGHVLVVKI